MGNHKMKVGVSNGYEAQKTKQEKTEQIFATLRVPTELIAKYENERYKDYFYFYIDYMIKAGTPLAQHNEDDVKKIFGRKRYNEVVNRLLDDNVILQTH